MATGTAHFHARRLPAASALRLGEIVGIRFALGALIAVSTALRAVAATAHIGPTLYPDEYIYTALARSLGTTGKPMIRGHVAHFPAMLEPLLAAPLWAIAPAKTAYHLVQVENALFLSLAAIPVYLLARNLDFRKPYALACAAFAVAIPDMVFAGRTLADPTAYPLTLAALYAGTRALQEPTRRRQFLFLVLAGLATFARVEYVLLVPAYVAAAFVTRRRAALKTHRFVLAVLAAGVAVALALGPSRVLGYYKEVVHLHVGTGLVGWFGNDVFLLVIASGVVLVPGAVVGLAKARGTRDGAFAAMTVFYTALLLIAAALYASNGADRFQERYLFSILPLVPLAFGLYLLQGRPGPRAVALLGAVLVVASVKLPLSRYETAIGTTDSPLLWALNRLDRLVGTGSSSLLFAAYAALSVALAIGVAFGVRARIAFATALAFLAATSILATSFDLRDTKERTGPGNPTWVDDSGLQDVTAVGTALAPTYPMTDQLYWNDSVKRELLLPGAMATDIFATQKARIAGDGTLLDADGPVRTPVLFEHFGATEVFQNARLVTKTLNFSLWQPHGVARLGLLEQGRYSDGWLGRSGQITLWPAPGHRLHGVLTLRFSLPAAYPISAVRFGHHVRLLRPGGAATIRLCVDSAGSWTMLFRGRPLRLPDYRVASVVQAPPSFDRGASCSKTTAA